MVQQRGDDVRELIERLARLQVKIAAALFLGLRGCLRMGIAGEDQDRSRFGCPDKGGERRAERLMPQFEAGNHQRERFGLQRGYGLRNQFHSGDREPRQFLMQPFMN